LLETVEKGFKKRKGEGKEGEDSTKGPSEARLQTIARVQIAKGKVVAKKKRTAPSVNTEEGVEPGDDRKHCEWTEKVRTSEAPTLWIIGGKRGRERNSREDCLIPLEQSKIMYVGVKENLSFARLGSRNSLARISGKSWGEPADVLRVGKEKKARRRVWPRGGDTEKIREDWKEVRNVFGG